MFDLIAFDADDTLWHNESLYAETQDKLAVLLADYADSETVIQRLYETEMVNLQYYGYGVKSFTLSMIETAVKLSNSHIQGTEIEKIIGFAREMLTNDTQLLEHVEATVSTLAQSYHLMIITKGDLLDQEVKLSRSRIGDYFQHVEIVSHKTPAIYADLLTRHKIEPRRFLMVGNSLKSDILPVVELGGHAVYIPYHVTWAHEVVEHQPGEHNGYYELEHIGQLPGLVEQLSGS
jgi:putative hydrolase of the HAD superfamily